VQQEGAKPSDRAALERFRRILLLNIGLLIVVGVCVALSSIWLGFSWFVIGLLVFFAVNAAYLAYLVRRFTKAGVEVLRGP
jgi:hypothetical protein